MLAEILSKLADALSMFWTALSGDERTIVVWMGGYFIVTLALTAFGAWRRRVVMEAATIAYEAAREEEERAR